MNYLKKIVTPCLMVLLMSCAVQSNEQPKIKQGIYGNVTWLEGNMMPSPNVPKVSNGRPVERTIHIYTTSIFKDVVGKAPLFTVINTKLVKTIKTNKNGYYECELPTGTYSVFTHEPAGGFFANSFNGKGEIATVEVKYKTTSRSDILINYSAAY